jgi:hypothetical protein
MCLEPTQEIHTEMRTGVPGGMPTANSCVVMMQEQDNKRRGNGIDVSG